jgi:capsular polysaccharide biosynthesis protein
MSTTPEGGSNDLTYYLEVPRRRWRVIAGVVLVALLASLLAVRFLPTTYTAQIVVSVTPLSSELFANGTSASDVIDLPAEVELVESDEVAQQAADSLGIPRQAAEIGEAIDATGGVGETTITITYIGDESDAAVKRVNAVGEAYLSQREDWAEGRRDQQLVQIDQQISELQEQREEYLRIIARAQRNNTLNRPAVLEAMDDRTLTTQELTDLQQRRVEAASLVLEPGILSTSASPGSTIASPSPALVLASGLALGLLLGLVLAFVRERTDRKVAREAVVRHLTGVPVLADVGSAAHQGWLSPEEEQRVQLLRSRLLAGIDPDTRVVFVVGGSSHQSGSGLARHLSESLARGGQQVSLLLVGGDGAGLGGETLSDTIEIDRVGMGVNGVELADLVQNPMIKNRIETLRTGSRFARGHAGNDLAIVAADAPLDRASVIALSRMADGVLVVVDPRVTRSDELDDIVSDIQDTGTPLVGTVMSRSDRSKEASPDRLRAITAR